MAKREIPFGTLKQRYGGRWYWKYYDASTGKHVERACKPAGATRATTNKAVARQIVRLYIDAMDGQHPPDTLEGLIDRLRDAVASESSPTNANHVRNKLRAFLTATGITDVAEFQPAVIQDYLAGLSLSASTVRNYRNALHRFGAFLVLRGLLDTNPVKVTAAPKVRNVLPEYIHKDREYALLRAAIWYGIYHEVAFALYTGLRKSELRQLRWGDIHETHITVGSTSPTKGNRPRTVPIAQKLHKVMRTMKRGKRTNPVFHLYEDWWSEHIRLLSHDPDWPEFHPAAGGTRYRGWHLLRHTFCTWLAQAGVPVVKIQRWAGHSSITTTMRYMHLAPGHDSDIDKL